MPDVYYFFVYMTKIFFEIISISHEPTYNSWPEVMTLVETVLHISIF